MAGLELARIPELSEKIAQIPAFGKAAQELQVNTPEDVEEAAALRKSITSVEKQIEDARVAAVRPYNEEVKAINAQAKEFLEALDSAKRTVKAKEIVYSERLEAARRARDAEEVAALREIDAAKTAAEVDAALAKMTFDSPSARMSAISRKNRIAEDAKMQEAIAAARAKDAAGAMQAAEQAAAIAERNADLEKAARDEAIRAEARAAAAGRAAAPKGVREVVKFEIVDATRVPRELCEPSEKLIRACIANAPQGSVAAGMFHINGVRVYVEKTIQ